MNNPTTDSEMIYIKDAVNIKDPDSKSMRRWNPSVGQETTALFEYLRQHKSLSEEAQIQVQDQAADILACCVPPTEPSGSDVGLVIGYVQSGKTMSFTTVTAMARDNGFQIIVVLTGTSVPLFNQSRDRLKQDLRCSDSGNPNRNFLFVENPRLLNGGFDDIRSALAVWKDEEAPLDHKRTLILLVMKNVIHLEQTKKVMLKLKDALQSVPVLIIDDEADQASLNNQVNKGSASPTYTHINELRHAIPHHSYLQYTATPQAPLLINVIDTLSPNFAQVLTPGAGYTGGKTFFVEHRELVKSIPESELPNADGPPLDIPESLKEAMRLFYLGVAAAYLSAGGTKGNRSMMIHPAVQRDVHQDYHQWVVRTSALWIRLLNRPDADHGKVELLAEFENDHKALSVTVNDLPPYEKMIRYIRYAIEQTKIIEVNTRNGKTPEVDWKKHYSWILVGGTALDRGFTVEGLTVTYMPREGGLGNADTIQQRARFFGYKGGYLGFCRVFLPDDLHHQYRSYTIHEENVRDQLIRHIGDDQPLNDWKRAFLLDSSLRPTRDSVLDLDFYRVKPFESEWFTLKAPHRPTEAVSYNREIVERFIDSLEMLPFKAHESNTEDQTHKRARTTLRDAYERLLVPLKWGHLQDTANFTGVLLGLEHRLSEDEDAGRPPTTCEIYLMSSGKPRKRKLVSDRVQNIYQGANDKTKYPGDREIKASDGEVVTIQIHLLNPYSSTKPNKKPDNNDTESSDQAQEFGEVYTVAIHSQFGHGAYIQDEL